MNNNNVRSLPPRGLFGRFMRKVSVADFVYRKVGESAPSFRSVIVLPNESMGDYLKGYDLTRGGWRTFKRTSIVGGVNVRAKHLDTVSLLVK